MCLHMKLTGDLLAITGVCVELVKVDIHAVSKNRQVSNICKVACLNKYLTNEEICIAESNLKRTREGTELNCGKIIKAEAGSDFVWASSVTLRSTREHDIFSVVARSCQLRHEEALEVKKKVEALAKSGDRQKKFQTCFGI